MKIIWLAYQHDDSFQEQIRAFIAYLVKKRYWLHPPVRVTVSESKAVAEFAIGVSRELVFDELGMSTKVPFGKPEIALWETGAMP